MRKTINVFLVLILLFGFVGYANGEDFERIADDLNHLGLFKGTDKGYELDKALTRAEGITLISRLLESEESIKGSNYWHPFKDVPKWADKSVGCMYYRGMVKGISRDKLGSDNYMSAKDFTTFILRVLWYNDSEGDFTWENSLDKAVEIGLYNEDYKKDLETKEFLRKDAVYMVKSAMATHIKGAPSSLMQNMVNNVLLDNDELTEVPMVSAINTVNKSTFGVKDTELYLQRKGVLEYKDSKVYAVLNERLYVFENDEIVDKSNIHVTDVLVGDELYLIGGDNDEALYRADFNDVNKMKKIVDLGEEYRYKMIGEYDGNIYCYKIDRVSYGLGKYNGVVEKVSIDKGSRELEQDSLFRHWAEVSGERLYYLENLGGNQYLKVKNLRKGEINHYSDGASLGIPLIADDKILISSENNLKLVEGSSWEQVNLYARPGGSIYALYNGWVYFNSYNDPNKVIKLNMFTGDAHKIIDHEDRVDMVLPTDKGIYWIGYNEGEAYLFKSDIDGGNKVKLK